MGKIKTFFKVILPPFILILYRKLFVSKFSVYNITTQRKKNQYWDGNYESWEIADTFCIGYDSDIIINKCFDAIQKIKNGEAIYERDSVLFDKKEYSTGLLAGLMLAGRSNEGEISVLDFGGSLGTTYFQNKQFFKYFESCKWGIIEQQKFFEIGKKHFQDKELMFFENIENCISDINPNVFFISSSLQYISDPKQILFQINNSSIRYVIFDRIPFSESENLITIQTVPPIIYEASYPCWIFNYDWLLKQLPNYKVIFEFPSFCDADQLINDGLLVQWKGITLELI
jgi:putative methyltransferase (TIGR04325 family)